MRHFYFNRFIIGRRFGEGESGTGTGTGTGTATVEFTPEQQAKINSIMAEERRKLQDRHKSELSDISKQLETFKGAAKEKEALTQKLTELQQQHLSKEELAKLELEKKQKEYEGQLTNTQKERDQFKSLFETTLARQAIAEAAVTHKAYSAAQLELLLSSKVKVVPVTDEQGNPTGGFTSVMPIQTKDGKIIEVSVSEGVGKLRESSEFNNLFLVDGTPGTGHTTINNQGRTAVDPNAPPSDPAAYREWRKKALNK